jgi:hypothetical protein
VAIETRDRENLSEWLVMHPEEGHVLHLKDRLAQRPLPPHRHGRHEQTKTHQGLREPV